MTSPVCRSVRVSWWTGYWPIKGEPDLRPLMAELHASGVSVALPVVELNHTPLVFRRWTPETRMVRGDWNISIPPQEAEVVKPDVTLAPLVGWDRSGYRRGYGGGCFDRTLAHLCPHPFAIVQGRQPVEHSAIRLMRTGQFALRWSDQRRQLGFGRPRRRHPGPVTRRRTSPAGRRFRENHFQVVRPSAANSGTTRNHIGDIAPPRPREAAPERSLCRGSDGATLPTGGHCWPIPAPPGALVLNIYIN